MEEQAEKRDILPNEAELVQKAKTDDAAFGVLYHHYFPRIYAFVVKRTSHRETAEDIVSAVFMNAFTHLESYETRSCTFGAWLYRIAANKVIDHYRKESTQKFVSIEDGMEIADTSFDMEVPIDLRIQSKKVQDALTKLKPPVYQKIVHLKFFSELSNREIAQAMEMSVNNAGVLLYRALKKFKKIYEAYV
ncbi:MAG: RNA polymerase sigma factor [Candidatus Magasanikbacteria bacterium]